MSKIVLSANHRFRFKLASQLFYIQFKTAVVDQWAIKWAIIKTLNKTCLNSWVLIFCFTVNN